MATFRLIHAKKAQYSVAKLCRSLSVSQSGYYAWVNRPQSTRAKQDKIFSFHIRYLFKESRHSYGVLRMRKELQDHDINLGKHRIRRLMIENNLIVYRGKKHKKTTDSRHKLPVHPNLLEQDFRADHANQKWVSDISYVRTSEGWGYLAVVMDLYSRKIVGQAFDQRMKKELVIQALQQAVTLRQPAAGLILHSDRGSQYCSHAYQKLLKKHDIRCSMSGKGNCYDNAPMESFFKTLKSECIWRKPYQTREQAKKSLADYINKFYNPKRRHSSLQYLSPIQFEQKNIAVKNNIAV